MVGKCGRNVKPRIKLPIFDVLTHFKVDKNERKKDTKIKRENNNVK